MKSPQTLAQIISEMPALAADIAFLRALRNLRVITANGQHTLEHARGADNMVLDLRDISPTEISEPETNSGPMKESLTSVVGWSGTAIPPSSQISFPGTPSGNRTQRRSILLSNMDISSTVTVLDQSGNSCLTVFPGTTITLPIAGFVAFRNATGNAISVYVSEVWYVRTI